MVNQYDFLPIFLGVVLLGMFGVVTAGIILFRRSRERPRTVRFGLRHYIFFVMEIYMLLFTMIVLWCVWQAVAISPGMWCVVGGIFLLLGEMGVWGWCAYQTIFFGREACVLPATEAVAGQQSGGDDGETTEERIGRRLLELFEGQHIYREFELHIEDVAMRIGTNRTYLSAALNKKYGYNFLKFVNHYRLNEACELLKSTSWPVCHIADRVGYKNLNTFNTCFRERFGLTPKQWRMNNMEV